MMITVESSNNDGYVTLSGNVGHLEIHDRLVARGVTLRVVALGALCQAKITARTSTAPLVGTQVELLLEE